MTVKSVFAGFGGQGVLMMGYLLALTAMREGKEVTYLPAYGAEVRGGTANCTVVVSEEEIASPVSSSPDVAVVMNNPSLLKYVNVVRGGGVILVNSSLVQASVGRGDVNVIEVPASDLAHELGEDRSANVVMLGAFAQVTGLLGLGASRRPWPKPTWARSPRCLS
jgi:2-oxoglutarate ferredoxin oxidoreductase subunit gamma